jgi:hypothetical protein
MGEGDDVELVRDDRRLGEFHLNRLSVGFGEVGHNRLDLLPLDMTL